MHGLAGCWEPSAAGCRLPAITAYAAVHVFCSRTDLPLVVAIQPLLVAFPWGLCASGSSGHDTCIADSLGVPALKTRTVDGVAKVLLRGGSVSGTASVTVQSGDAGPLRSSPSGGEYAKNHCPHATDRHAGDQTL
jgi:hypothetical protein